MNTKAEQKERTHETILRSASRLLREKGISGASVADVMKGAGLTVGGFYAHFASKDALIDDTIRRTGDERRASLFARLEELPVPDRVEEVLKRYLSEAHRDRTNGGCPMPAIVGEVGTTAPEHREALRADLDATASKLEAHLPTPTEGLSRRQLALALMALMYGGLSLARALRGSPLSDEVLQACRTLGTLAVRRVSAK